MTSAIYPAKRSEYFDDPLIDERRKELQVTAASFDELAALIKQHDDGASSFRHIPGAIFEDTFFPGCVARFLWYATTEQKARLCQTFGFPDDSVLESWAMRKTFPTSTNFAYTVLLTMQLV